MNLLSVGFRSLLNRRFTVLLTVLSIAISVVLLLGVDKVRHNAKASFANTISGVDLVVGARSGRIPLLLYSVFRIGNATNNITWKSYQEISAQPGVQWTIPISLGDSHRGYRVMGTTLDYFEHYRFGRKRALSFSAGGPFSDTLEVVLGSEVAASLGYTLGSSLVIAHGLGDMGLVEHDEKPFQVTGILDRTGTPIDRTLHVSLESIEAIHANWQQGDSASSDPLSARRLQPNQITAFMVGLESRAGVFNLQRFINQYDGEPLLAILPGVALQELWGLMSVAERALTIVAVFVAVAAFLGMIAVSLASLNERRREIAILRAVGAGLPYIAGLMLVETLILTSAGIAIGLVSLYTGLALLQPVIESAVGLYLPIDWPTTNELGYLAVLLVVGILCGVVPALKAYRQALVDGLTVDR